MPSPIGHTLAGLAVLAGHRRLALRIKTAAMVILLANLPDFDFLLGFAVGVPNRYNHHFTHSFIFVIVAGFFAAFVCAKKNSTHFRDYAVLFLVTGFLHVILDLFAVDTSAPYGAPIFWPFSSDYYIAPISLFTDIKRSASMQGFWSSLFSVHNMVAIGREVVLLAPISLVLLWTRIKR